jgi:hypothetical protein
MYIGPYVPRSRNPNSTWLPPIEDFGLRFGNRKLPLDLQPLHHGIDVVAVQMAPGRNEPSFAVSVARDGAVRDFVMLPPVRAGLNGDQEQVGGLRRGWFGCSLRR